MKKRCLWKFIILVRGQKKHPHSGYLSRNLLSSRISGKLLLIIWYYTVYRNCKYSLQTEHHTYLALREQPEHGKGGRQNTLTWLGLPVAGRLFPIQKSRRRLAECAQRSPATSRKICAQRRTWTSLRQAEGRRDLCSSATAKPTPCEVVCASRFNMLPAPIRVITPDSSGKIWSS